MSALYGIAIVTRLVYPNSTGGAEIHTYYIAKELAKSQNVILISEGSYPVSSQRNLHHLYFENGAVSFLSSIVFVLKALVLLLVNRRCIDVMHSQIALSPVVVGIMAKTLLHKPFIITCHGSEVRLQKNYLIKIVQRIAFSIADYVTVVSHEMQSLLVSNYHVNSNKLDVIPNGYDPVLLENCPKNDDATCYITYVGRLSYPKDPMTLLLAFEKINKNVPNVNLQYVGEGQLSPLLKEFCSRRKLSRNVQFLGKLPHCKTIESIARSTVFVLSSFEEGLPTSLIEAMALRKPVVATSVGGVPEIVRNGVNGFLVPPKAPQQTADILIKLLRNPRIREELGVAAAESVQDYSWDKIARRYEKLYCKLLQKQKAC